MSDYYASGVERCASCGKRVEDCICPECADCGCNGCLMHIDDEELLERIHALNLELKSRKHTIESLTAQVMHDFDGQCDRAMAHEAPEGYFTEPPRCEFCEAKEKANGNTSSTSAA